MRRAHVLGGHAHEADAVARGQQRVSHLGPSGLLQDLGDVLNDDVLRLHFLDDAEHLEPQAGPCVLGDSFALPGVAEVGAGEASADDVVVRQGPGQSHIRQLQGIRPVVLEDQSALRINLHLAESVCTKGLLDREV